MMNSWIHWFLAWHQIRVLSSQNNPYFFISVSFIHIVLRAATTFSQSSQSAVTTPARSLTARYWLDGGLLSGSSWLEAGQRWLWLEADYGADIHLEAGQEVEVRLGTVRRQCGGVLHQQSILNATQRNSS